MTTPSDPSSAAPRLWLTVLIALAAAAVLGIAWLTIRTPATLGTAFHFKPDSCEYTLIADTCLREGRLGFRLNDLMYPSRYLPWFSLSILLPAEWLTGDVRGAAAGVNVMAMLALLLAMLAGRRAAGPGAGVLAAAAVFGYPAFAFYGGTAMTEVPYTALTFLVLWRYQNLCDRIQPPRRDWLILGFLIAWCGAVRSTGYLLLALPLLAWRELKHPDDRYAALPRLLIPSGLMLLAGMAYNFVIFGTPLRGGYAYWCPVPYDYPELVFGLGYLKANLALMKAEPVVPAAALALATAALAYFAKAGHDPTHGGAWEALHRFWLWTGLTTALVYLPYFYFEGRLWLPFGALSMLTMAVNTAVLANRLFRRFPAALLLLPLLAVGWSVYVKLGFNRPPEFVTYEINLLRYCHEAVPDGGILLTSSDPAMATRFFVDRSQRRIFPLLRWPEYVDKVVMKRKLEHPDPFPANAADHRSPAILAAGIAPFPKVIEENPEELDRMLKEDAPVFISSFELEQRVGKALLGRMQEHALFVPFAQSRWCVLYQLKPRPRH